MAGRLDATLDARTFIDQLGQRPSVFLLRCIESMALVLRRHVIPRAISPQETVKQAWGEAPFLCLNIVLCKNNFVEATADWEISACVSQYPSDGVAKNIRHLPIVYPASADVLRRKTSGICRS